MWEGWIKERTARGRTDMGYEGLDYTEGIVQP